MERERWMETSEDKRAVQLDNVANTIDTYKTELDISDEVADYIKDANKMYKYARKYKGEFLSKYESWVEFFNELDKGMVSDPVIIPGTIVLDTIPTLVPGGIFTYLGSQRTIWMKHPNWTEAIGYDMHILGHGVVPYNPLTYKAKYIIDVLPGNIHFKILNVDVKNHNLYCRIAGVEAWTLVTTILGPSFNYHRILAVAKQVENLELMLKGYVNNAEIGVPSTKTIVFPG
ncbi:MAG: hypothetical protein WCL14_02580 [Bacteroidota bacterium]